MGVLDYITEVRTYGHVRLHQVYLADSKRNALKTRQPSLMMMIFSLLKTWYVQDNIFSTLCQQ